LSRVLVNLRVVGALGARSVKQTFRRPQLAAPILIFPTLLLAVQTGGAGQAVELDGFPEVNGFLDFMLAGAMIQACLLAGNTGGIALAVDLEMGFTDRLFAAPISRFAIVAGRLAGTAVLGAITALWFVAIGLARRLWCRACSR
jgi:ABC-2 type transport system permease protein